MVARGRIISAQNGHSTSPSLGAVLAVDDWVVGRGRGVEAGEIADRGCAEGEDCEVEWAESGMVEGGERSCPRCSGLTD
jgi:hypothetical protein